MKAHALVLCLLVVISVSLCQAQQVDVVRLGYQQRDIQAEQEAMAASPDGKFIGFMYDDNTIKIFDVMSGKVVKRFKGPFSDVLDFFLTSGGVAALIRNKEVVLIDWKKEETLLKLALSNDVTKATYSGST